jgi:predicted O-methyltransferase YrrM
MRPMREPHLVTPALRKAIRHRMLMVRQAAFDRIGALTKSSPEELRRLRQELSEGDLPERLLQRGAGLPFTHELPQGALLYLLVRSARPRRIVETGVRPGYSTAWLLEALDRNGDGELFSIGPGTIHGRASGVSLGTVGEFVPPALRSRWTLVLGNSTDRLSEVLGSVGPIDFFFSDNGPDSDRTRFELRKAWAAMTPGGLMVAHHIDANRAWSDFCQWQGLPAQVLDTGPPPMGALSVRSDRAHGPA